MAPVLKPPLESDPESGRTMGHPRQDGEDRTTELARRRSTDTEASSRLARMSCRQGRMSCLLRCSPRCGRLSNASPLCPDELPAGEDQPPFECERGHPLGFCC